MRFRLVVDGESLEVEVDRYPKGLRVRVDGAEYRARATSSPPEFAVRIGRRVHRIRFQGQAALVGEACYEISVPEIERGPAARFRDETTRGASLLEIRPPMPGRVIRILAPVGTRVTRGQILLVLEAMKMQNEIPAPRDGIVREVRVGEGESITADRVVALLEVR
ncbi:MAG: biotin/lipoyl-containing protein [Thermoplasmata archaeon]